LDDRAISPDKSTKKLTIKDRLKQLK